MVNKLANVLKTFNVRKSFNCWYWLQRDGTHGSTPLLSVDQRWMKEGSSQFTGQGQCYCYVQYFDTDGWVTGKTSGP